MSCQICNDTHWKSIEVDGVEQVVRCDCWRNNITDRLISSARIPPRFARTELEKYEPDTDTQRGALDKALGFVNRFGPTEKGLLFYGPIGVGKTHLAIGILKAVIRQFGAKGYFFETPDLLRQVRHTYNEKVDETEMGILRPVLEADILVLDDLGTEKTSEWVQETLGLVINSRYNCRRPTIITSNLNDSLEGDPYSFAFQIGMRSRSRLLEMCEWVKIEGSDVRDRDRDRATAQTGRLPIPPDNIKKGLPDKTRAQVRAQLREKQGPVDLKWTGGKGGS